MESIADGMTNSFCNQLTDELVRLCQRLKSRNVTAQIDAIDIVQMAWKSAWTCLLYTSPSPRDRTRSRMPSSA